jgi:hypothetical protein
MYKISCDYCFEDNLFEYPDAPPLVCANCNTPIGHLEIRNENETVDLEKELSKPRILNGLTLIYEKTGEKIELEHSEIIILGRMSKGKELLGKIPQISREHCKIEFINGNYVLTDLNSMNGTFIGVSRRDCRKHQMVKISDNDIIYLGREPFTVQLKYKTLSADDSFYADFTEDEIKVLHFKCRACGKIHNMNLLICDNCGSYGQLETLDG